MKKVRLFALLLALATGAFVLYGTVSGDLRGPSLFVAGIATLVAAGGALRMRRMSLLDRWMVPGATATYSFLMLASVGLHYLQVAPFLGRVGLSLLLMLGLLLCMRAAYVVTRRRQYGFHNYFDRPARS